MRLWHVLKPRLVAENDDDALRDDRAAAGARCWRAWRRAASPSTGRSSAASSGDFAQRAAAFEAEAYELAGSSFNLGSPKQLGEILFDRMKLEGGTKTKTGAWATGADVLEDLAAKGVPLARTIVDWRQLTKLMGTYTDALPDYINPRTGRVHTIVFAVLGADRAAELERSEPAEHPGPHRGRPQDPNGVRRGAGQDADLRRLQPDRAARPRPHRRYPGAEGRLRGRASTSTP